MLKKKRLKNNSALIDSNSLSSLYDPVAISVWYIDVIFTQLKTIYLIHENVQNFKNMQIKKLIKKISLKIFL